MSIQSEDIKQFIIHQVNKHPSDIVAVCAKQFNITRTTVHRHLQTLIKLGFILKSGTTRNIKYASKTAFNRKLTYTIDSKLSEFAVIKNDFQDIFQTLSQNVYDICFYGFTEMFNNALDHSQAKKINVSTHFTQQRLNLVIEDNGMGVFKSICDYLQLDDIRESVLQLSKGKITTDPSNHTGEGIFFTSRAVDIFEIYANQLHYFRDNQAQDWSFEAVQHKTVGSSVHMTIDLNSSAYLVDIFRRYQSLDDLSFSRTDILVKLSHFGDEPLISRSQAKRIIFGLEKFQHITLDFTGVRLVGQGFVDDIFRVFMAEHPTIVIDYIHANDDVTFMIQRAI